MKYFIYPNGIGDTLHDPLGSSVTSAEIISKDKNQTSNKSTEEYVNALRRLSDKEEYI